MGRRLVVHRPPALELASRLLPTRLHLLEEQDVRFRFMNLVVFPAQALHIRERQQILSSKSTVPV
jgi:hypothetical protein